MPLPLISHPGPIIDVSISVLEDALSFSFVGFPVACVSVHVAEGYLAFSLSQVLQKLSFVLSPVAHLHHTGSIEETVSPGAADFVAILIGEPALTIRLAIGPSSLEFVFVGVLENGRASLQELTVFELPLEHSPVSIDNPALARIVAPQPVPLEQVPTRIDKGTPPLPQLILRVSLPQVRTHVHLTGGASRALVAL